MKITHSNTPQDPPFSTSSEAAATAASEHGRSQRWIRCLRIPNAADPTMMLMMTTIPAAMDNSVFSATGTTILLVGAGCFAMGYFLASTSDCGGVGACRLMAWIGSVFKTRDASTKPLARKEEDGFDRKGKTKKKKSSEPLEIEALAEILEDFKMVLVVRNDLKMGKGKIAAQCSHATLGLYKKLLRRAPKSLNKWEMCGQVKVVLKSESEEDLLVLQERAKSLHLPAHITVDAGRTQIAPNSRTVMAILGPADLVDDVTGGLKLL